MTTQPEYREINRVDEVPCLVGDHEMSIPAAIA
jgi:hypothetical protein